MNALVAREQAEAEINEWLDYKKVNTSKREAQKESIELLVCAVMDGELMLNADKTLTQKLKFPIEGEGKTETLVFKPRVKVSTIHSHLQGVKPSDGDGRLCAYVAAITGNPKALISAMETDDYSTAQAIAFFFI